MGERLFRAGSSTTPRMHKPHWADDRMTATFWMPKKTNDIFWASQDPFIFLRALLNPELYSDLQISTKKIFFDESEHWVINLCYHVTDELLLKKLDSGETTCEVCRTAGAVLIDGITDLDTNVRSELAMCVSCFDKKADMSRAD